MRGRAPSASTCDGRRQILAVEMADREIRSSRTSALYAREMAAVCAFETFERRLESTFERNRSRGSRGDGRQEVRKGDGESEGSNLSQDRGVQPHARQEFSRCSTSPSARCVSA